MALRPKYPRLVSKKGNGSFGKGKMSGRTPKQGGHPVGGKGKKTSRGGSVGRSGK